MIRLTTSFLALALTGRGRRRRARPGHGGAAEAAAAELELLRPVRHVTIRRSCSAASRSTRKCAATATGSAFRSARSSDPDGPGYSEAQVKALAASYQVVNDEPNDKGEIFKRPGTPADIFPPPDSFPNDQAAAAALGKAPPDMALLAKARKYERGFPWFVFDALPFDQYQEMGADYIYAILTGYTKADDPQWNLYYPGHRIAMPQPIVDGAVAYTDGTPAKLDNYARDVAAFLSWASEPYAGRSARRSACG